MKLSEMKARIAAFGLAMLMAVSPLGSAAKVSAAETPKIPVGADAKADLTISGVDALDIKKSVTDDTFRPEICMEGIRYDANKEDITLVSIKGEDRGKQERTLRNIWSCQRMGEKLYDRPEDHPDRDGRGIPDRRQRRTEAEEGYGSRR